MKTVPGFTMLSGRPVMVLHTFYATADGQLAHETDGTLRATVPPEGWADYCQQYPDAQEVVDSLTIKPLSERVDEQLQQVVQNVVSNLEQVQ
jgi:predicted transglutaminase-like cysteine proteinase